MRQNIINDKVFYKKLLSIALPITFQNLISSSLNMVDTLMIGRLGETEIASVAIPNQYFFLFVLILFGVNSGGGIFIAQFWGKKDIENIKKVLGITLLTGGFIAIIFSFGGLSFTSKIIGIFSKDNKVIMLGSKYLKIVSISYIITAISFSYGFASRSLGRAKLPMVASIIALSLNTIINYLLIFGHFGFPQLGIVGAAIATLISRVVELLIILSHIYLNKTELAAKISELLNIKYEFIKKFFITTSPVILNEAFWALGMTMYTVAYGKIGTNAITTVQISNTIQNIFMVITMGIANACAIMIGNKIGANEEEEGINYAKKFSIISILTGVFIGLTIFLFSPNILNFFTISNAVYNDSLKVLRIMSMFMIFKVFNSVLIVGILRSGGDTKYSMLLEMGSVWGVGVPLAFIGVLVLKLSVYQVITLVFIEEAVKAVFGIKRVISKKWIRNVVEDL